MITTKLEENKNVIKVGKIFDYSEQAEFRKAYESLPNNLPVEVDLSNTEFLDSAALGMLIILRDHLGGDKAKIKLMRPKENVLSILQVSNFNKLFTIE